MKCKRILCVALTVLMAVSLLVLPAQAAAKPAFQWLADFAKREGEYDSANKIYVVSWYMDESEWDVISLEYDASDNTLYCVIFDKTAPTWYTALVLKPGLSAPYQVIVQNGNTYAAEYSVNPGSYTETTKLHYNQFYGDRAYQDQVDMKVNADVPDILESISNLMILSGSNYRLKDLGFSNFKRHFLHVESDPELVNEFHCGGNTLYRRRCLICGRERVYDQWESHIQGDFHWVLEPTCTEGGYGYYICSRCGAAMGGGGYLYHEELGHDWELTSLDEPINDETHVHGQFRCKRCGEEKADEYCAADFFKDMPARGSWAHTPIDWAFANEITAGTSATSFSPNKGCTRGQVVTFLWRAAGCPEPEKSKTSFTDLKPGAFYENAVAWAVENGITNGVTETAFGPDATCTRGQIVTFLWRFRESPASEGVQSAFTDLKPGAFYLDAVAWAVENSVTNGMTNTTFCPDLTCTRAQVVTFLYRAMRITKPEPENPIPTPTDPDMPVPVDPEP